MFDVHSSNSYILCLTEPPDCPSDLHAMDINSRTVTIAWGQPFAGNSPLLGYQVELRRFAKESSSLEGSGGSVAKEVLEPGATSYALKNLEPQRTYQLVVSASNIIGDSLDCPPIKVTTDGEAPSAPPRDVKLSAVSSTSLSVTWRPPPGLGDLSVVQGYYVGYRLAATSDPFAYKTVESGSLESCSLSGLKKNARYVVVVQAFNAKGAGPPSDEYAAQTLEFGKLRLEHFVTIA